MDGMRAVTLAYRHHELDRAQSVDGDQPVEEIRSRHDHLGVRVLHDVVQEWAASVGVQRDRNAVTQHRSEEGGHELWLIEHE
jgi:hypothetical protein